MVDGSVGEFWLKTEQTLERIRAQPGETVLEVGPGPGRLLVPLAKRVEPGGHALGIELQEAMADRLGNNAAKMGVTNLDIIRSDVNAATLEPSSVDVAVLCTVLGEIPDRAQALTRIYNALKVGGRLSVTEIIPDPHYQRRTIVRQLAEDAGFAHDQTVGNAWHFTMNFRKPESSR